ncbi:MAG: hypothetical protein LUD68_02295 [Rikenellaceae bacterium]|nr:hypothetical protein [Rikenellaceae bacterium]
MIANNHIYLWEMADGQYTIKEIIEHENSPYKNQGHEAVAEVMDFYKKMSDSYALLLSSY